MPTIHATHQRIGTRSHQCDTTATAAGPYGRHAFVLLDGIGSTDEVQHWTRHQARTLAQFAAAVGDPVAAIAGLRTAISYDIEHPSLFDATEPPSAVAVVAIHKPGQLLTVGWCGDSRAYWLPAGGTAELITHDHNVLAEEQMAGRSCPLWYRNRITSHLGSTDGCIGLEHRIVTCGGRLLLASDGTYNPLEDHGHNLTHLLGTGTPRDAARTLVATALGTADPRHDNATTLVVDIDPA
ncbi:serine/threonine protein phosphatase [Streptomyces sp. NBC_00842]|uniref:PP2C family protein-serine/threonine phosphatase n=1 Tax=Streptomyces sp. NBC_00842 TaxID=2975848 RepID=UPI002F90F3FC|nr:serine/threonine protein phosphatase [Streptomyces sp. NBC_00842]